MAYHIPAPSFLSPEEGATLVRAARSSLERFLSQRQADYIRPEPWSARFAIPHGAFVTLRRGQQLRGCIGTVDHERALGEAVHYSALRSASQDPRFYPVTVDEIDTIRIEVSALAHGDSPESPFSHLHEPREVRLGIDGLMIDNGAGRSGLLLPQVPVDRKWNVQQFLDAVCQKARLPAGAWKAPNVYLYRFSAQVFSEVD